MFKEIRNKITLFTTLILISFLFLFIIFFVFLVQKGIGISGEIYLHNIAMDIIEDSSESNDFNGKKANNDRLGYDYIIWNESDNVREMRVDNKNLIIKGYEYKKTATSLGTFLYFDLDSNRYRYYGKEFYIGTEPHVVQVFQIVNVEQILISYLIICLFFVGIGGILILIPISYFIAGKAINPIKKNYEQQKKFIGNVSHELRTPLTVIHTNIEVLRLKEDEVLANNLHWLNNISIEVDNMTALISNMLILAHADSKHAIQKIETFDISAVCAEVTDLMFDVAKEQEVSLISNIPKGIEYKGQEETIKRAIRILVDNAIKYSNPQGQVTLTLSDTLRFIQIAISDNGIGISEEEQKKIFNRFYRIDNARDRSTGFGLGLNIADEIVKMHNGSIKVESEINEGSTFTIILPKTII